MEYKKTRLSGRFIPYTLYKLSTEAFLPYASGVEVDVERLRHVSHARGSLKWFPIDLELSDRAYPTGLRKPVSNPSTRHGPLFRNVIYTRPAHLRTRSSSSFSPVAEKSRASWSGCSGVHGAGYRVMQMFNWRPSAECNSFYDTACPDPLSM